MCRCPLIAAISLLFLAIAVSGHIPPHAGGGQKPSKTIKQAGGSNVTMSLRQNGARGNAPNVPTSPAGLHPHNVHPAQLFGWDPERAKKKCAPPCDKHKCLLQEEFLTAHNWVRNTFKQVQFTWDEKLASAASKYAMQRHNDCKMIHSDMPHGENLFWGKNLHWTPSDAVFFWYAENHWYDFNTLKCSAPQGKDCAHFTQIVWKESVHLGCALQHCADKNKGMLIICEYDPPGNFANENPLGDQKVKRQL